LLPVASAHRNRTEESPMFRITATVRGLAALLVLASGHAAGAQPGSGTEARYPSKPVRMIVPLAPGGGSDIVGRVVAQAMTRYWGQSVVVDNRPGAGSNIGTTIAARSAPDGYSLLVTSSSFAVGPALYGKPGYDPVKDFEPITM